MLIMHICIKNLNGPLVWAIDAVKGVTVNAAKMCGLEKTKGSLEVGKQADIIAVKENPLENVSTLQDVRFVMKHGDVYKAEMQ